MVDRFVDIVIIFNFHTIIILYKKSRSRRGRDRKVVGFMTTYASSAYHHKSNEFEPRSWLGVLDTILSDKVCQ